VKCFDAALKINSQVVLPWVNKGIVLQNLQKYKQAIKCFDRALKIDPKNIEAWVTKGNLLKELDMGDEASKCYDRALEIDSATKSNRKALRRKVRKQKCKKD